MNVNKYVVVDSLEQAYQILNEDRKNKILAGGAWIKISVKDINHMISLDNLSLDYIKEDNGFVEIGAMTPLRDIETNSVINDIDEGVLAVAISKIMGINIRNLATIGGSIMGKFSFSDILPVLLTLDCTFNFYKAGEVSVEEFVEGKKLTNDILTHIKIKKTNNKSFFKKVSNTPLDFSWINISITKGDRFHIAVGSRPGIAKLAKNAMALINSAKAIDDELILKVVDRAIEELELGDNIRASKEYREVLVKTYLKRGLKQVIK